MTTTNLLAGAPGIVDRKNQEKLYIQVMRLVVDEIGRGTWVIGDRIPSEDELAVRFGVSKITIRQALSNLAADGYLMKVQGRGTFVAGNRPVVGLTMKTGFTDGLFGRGVQEAREVLERGAVEPPEEVRRLLGIDGPIYRIATRRLAEGVPVSSDSLSYRGIAPRHRGAGPRRLQAVCGHSGTRDAQGLPDAPDRRDHHPDGPGGGDSRGAGRAPVLAVHRLLIGAEDQPLAYSRIVEIGERFKLETEFERIR